MSILPGMCIFWCHTSRFCWCGAVCWCGFWQKTPAKTQHQHQQNKENTSRFITLELMKFQNLGVRFTWHPCFICCAPRRRGQGRGDGEQGWTEHTMTLGQEYVGDVHGMSVRWMSRQEGAVGGSERHASGRPPNERGGTTRDKQLNKIRGVVE